MSARVIDKRRLTWGVAAIIIAAAFLLVMVSVGDAALDNKAIDTAAPIEPGQCLPCHLNIAEVQVPGVIFSHGSHLLVSCDGCHSRMPHRDSATEHVPMEVCFACHGVEHGPSGELASGRCKDCHTPAFKLRPKSHAKTWAKKPHADKANAIGVNSCMMCHDAPEDCDACHRREKVDIGKMPGAYHPMIGERPKGASIKIYPDGPTTMAQCVYCHADLDDITPGRLIFAHAAHIQRNYDCKACHPSFAHDNGKIEKPDMMSCYRCHGVYHNGSGLVANGQDCLKCHPKSFELMPNDHTKKFIKGSHGKRAGADPAYCAMCHASSFCVGCHQGKKTSPNAVGKLVIPADHKKAKWRKDHGEPFLEGDGACGACHDDRSCKRCHKTVMPHPVGWIDNHQPERGVGAEDCNVCHSDRSSCQKCHHQSVERGILTKASCAKGPDLEGCHAEMNTSDPASIQHKGFAEHAVHFEVSTRSIAGGVPKDEPYTCDECHIGFATIETVAAKSSAGGALPDAGHDVRLCYGCHGSVDYRNRVIAPWPGAQLCLRCHRGLNF